MSQILIRTQEIVIYKNHSGQEMVVVEMTNQQLLNAFHKAVVMLEEKKEEIPGVVISVDIDIAREVVDVLKKEILRRLNGTT